MNELTSTLYTFAKICSDKNEEPLFVGNKKEIKSFFEKNLNLDEMNFNSQFDNLIISKIVYAKRFESNSHYTIPKGFAKFYSIIEDKILFDEVGKKFYDELKFK